MSIPTTGTPTEIGNRIRNRRKAMNWTQGTIAKALGVAIATINKYETGLVSNIPRNRIDALAKILMVSPAYLLCWTDDPDDYMQAPNPHALFQYQQRLTQLANSKADAKKREVKYSIASKDMTDEEEELFDTTDAKEARKLIETLKTKEAQELLRIYSDLSVRDRMKLIQFAFDLEEAGA